MWFVEKYLDGLGSFQQNIQFKVKVRDRVKFWIDR